MEEFKPIKGFSLYEISNTGVIRKVMTKEIVSQRIHPKDGLCMCDLRDNDLIARTIYPHKEVAKAFVRNYKKGNALAVHINGIKTDNRAENLKWVTQAEYQQMQIDRGTRKTMGNPELFKHSKFWQESQKRKKGKKTVKEIILKKVAPAKAAKTKTAATKGKVQVSTPVIPAIVKRGRPAKVVEKIVAVKAKRGRPKQEKIVTTPKAIASVVKKKGRPAKATKTIVPVAISKPKRGRPSLKAATETPKTIAPAKTTGKRGRPAKAEKIVSSAPKGKRGRPKKEVQTIARPSQIKHKADKKPIAVKKEKINKQSDSDKNLQILIDAIQSFSSNTGKSKAKNPQQAALAAALQQMMAPKSSVKKATKAPVKAIPEKKAKLKAKKVESKSAVTKTTAKRGRPAKVVATAVIATAKSTKAVQSIKKTGKALEKKKAIPEKIKVTKVTKKEEPKKIIAKRGRPAKAVTPAIKAVTADKKVAKVAKKTGKVAVKAEVKTTKAISKKEPKAKKTKIEKALPIEKKTKAKKIDKVAAAKAPIEKKKAEKPAKKVIYTKPVVEKPTVKTETKKVEAVKADTSDKSKMNTDNKKIVNLFKTPLEIADMQKENGNKKRKRIVAKKVFTAKVKK